MAHSSITPPLRALIVTPSGVLGGAESWLLSMLDHTERLRPWVAMLEDGPLRTVLLDRGIPVLTRPVGRTATAIAAGAGWLARELRELDPDVVVGNGVKAQCVVAPAALATGVPSVWIKHDYSHDRRLARWLAQASGRVVATAEEVGLAARRDDTLTITPPRPHPPIPRDEALQVLRALNLPAGDRLLLVMPVRFVPYKGVDTAIRALAEPAAADWDLVAVGPDDPRRPGERERLARLAADWGVGSRVHLRATVPAVGRLLAGADAVGVLTRPAGPRTPGREGFGLTALEAQLAGVPIIAVDDGSPVARRVGAQPFGAVHRAAGLLVPPADPEAVARALAALAGPDGVEVRAGLGAEGRRRSESHPDAVTQAARLSALLAEVAHRPGAGLCQAEASPISVVSPVLDEAATIDSLIGTLAAQLGPDDEYVLVDGGSTDGTAGRITAWSAGDERIRLVQHGGGTIGYSRNLGVAAARHPFIACTDAGCTPAPGWLDGFRAAAAETAAAARRDGDRSEQPIELYVGVYRAAVRAGRWFEPAMAAMNWPDPVELRRRTAPRLLYGKLFGRAFSAERVDGRSVGFTRALWTAAGGFPEQLQTAEDEAFGRAAQAVGARSALTLDAAVTWYQRHSVREAFAQFRGYGRGGGKGRSALLLRRDFIRLGGYVGTAAALTWGGKPGRVLALVGAAGYLSLPVARVLRRRQSPLVIGVIPLAAVVKDVAKLVGTAEALLAPPPADYHPRHRAGDHIRLAAPVATIGARR